jgi:hypothetical protein
MFKQNLIDCLKKFVLVGIKKREILKKIWNKTLSKNEISNFMIVSSENNSS